ncbi:hypothetical protein BJX65DRAFT_179943 [Aspergillus insuetus]
MSDALYSGVDYVAEWPNHRMSRAQCLSSSFLLSLFLFLKLARIIIPASRLSLGRTSRSMFSALASPSNPMP